LYSDVNKIKNNSGAMVFIILLIKLRTTVAVRQARATGKIATGGVILFSYLEESFLSFPFLSL
jgi:hypothetical protein